MELNKNIMKQATEKQKRIDIVNQIVDKISKTGRRFFYNNRTDFTSKIILKHDNIYFIDHYSRIEIPLRLSLGDHWRSFNHGGTIKALVLDFYDFINTGDKSNHNHGYGGLYCPHWGYTEEAMQEIQKLAKELGYL